MRRSQRFPVMMMLAASTALTALACQRTPPPPANSASAATANAPQTFQDSIFLAAARAALPPPGVNPADLPQPNSEGAHLVTKYCTVCHALPTPLAHSATDWPHIVRRMWLRMDIVAPTFHIATPSVAERAVIVPYLVENSLKVVGTALPPGPGREVFSVTCSRCHELPDPHQHSSADWVAVVRRMSGHLQDILGQTLTADQLQTITAYLENVSGMPAK